MAKIVKRYWWLVAIQILLIALASVFLTHHFFAHAQSVIASADGQDPPATQPSATDPILYARIQSLRAELDLRNEDLAAMGCDQARVESVIAALRGWYQQNATAWTERESARNAAVSALARSVRDANRGEATVETVATRQSEMQQANAAWRQLTAGAAAAVQSLFSDTETSVWTVARQNHTLASSAPARYRYASGLSTSTVRKLRTTAAKYGIGSPRTVELENGLLPSSARTQISNALNSQLQHSEMVLAGERKALPPPEPNR